MDPALELQLKEKIKEALLDYFNENNFKEQIFQNENQLFRINKKTLDVGNLDVNYNSISLKVNAWQVYGINYYAKTVYWELKCNIIKNGKVVMESSINPRSLNGKCKNAELTVMYIDGKTDPAINLKKIDFNLSYIVKG